MGETGNIAKISEILSDELFAEFFWEKIGPSNFNWPCEAPDQHKLKTHPADVVFFYDEPYSLARTYVHCDLKSYSQSSISVDKVRSAVKSLAKQVSCAEKSAIWREKYIHSNVTPEICGLLFIYNHDGDYDKSFVNILAAIKDQDVDLPKGGRLVILGPHDIHWLDNIRYEIRQMRGTSKGDCLPPRENCKFFYPQLERKSNVRISKAKAATLEMLTAPWVILEYNQPQIIGRRGIIVFYRRNGSTEDEFIYLINYLRHYQVLDPNTDIQIKTLNAVDSAHSMFQKGIDRYVEKLGDYELAKLVKSIKYSKITQVKSSFSDVELGMDYAR